VGERPRQRAGKLTPSRETFKRRAAAFRVVVRFLDGATAIAVLAALLGVAPGRTLPAAAFLLVYAAVRGGNVLARRAMGRRARTARAADVPWGVRLEKPIWMWLAELPMALVAIGAVLAAAVAVIGFPGAGLGVLLGFGGLAAMGLTAQESMAVTRLTFEVAGLRLHLAKASLLVPWARIAGVDPTVPNEILTVQVTDAPAVLRGLSPDTAEARKSLPFLLEKHGKIWLGAWAGGFDAETLTAAIESARRRPPPRAN
jgi:hypothetical protein